MTGWRNFTIEEVVKEIIDHRGKTPTKLRGAWSDSGIPVLSAKNVKTGQLVHIEEIRFVDTALYNRWMPVKLSVGDTIVTSEAPIGEAYYLREETEYCLGQRLFALRPDPAIVEPRFLYYRIISRETQFHLQARASGSTVQGIRQAELRKVQLALPPLPIQRRIAAILGALDDKIEVNRRINRTLEAMAHALYKWWFVDFGPFQDGAFVESELGLIPEGWQAGILGDIATNVRVIVDPQQVDPETPYIGLADMPQCSITLDTWGVAVDSISAKSRMRKGQLLFGKLRPYFKKVGVTPLDGVCSTDILVIEPKEPEQYAQVLGQLIQQEFIDYTNSVSDGTRMPRVSWHMMKKYRVAIPDAQTTCRFNRTVKPWLDMIVCNIHETRSLVSTRDYLLPRLLSGEVAVGLDTY
jgi:type I restriction enzyme, S subunit